VIGIDLSRSMLDQAHVAAAGIQLDLHIQDMRELTVEEPAGLIYCSLRSLMHLSTWADRRRTNERVAVRLRPKGGSPGMCSSSITSSRSLTMARIRNGRFRLRCDYGARSSLWWGHEERVAPPAW